MQQIVTELDTTLLAQSATSLIDLPSDSDILLVLSQLPILVTRSVNPDDAALSGSQKVVQLLYRAETDLAREAYAALLERLCALSDKVAREVIAWLIYAEDEVSEHVIVLVSA